MTRILHLSDVHLAPVGVDPDAGDYKEHAVPAGERQSRHGLISDALVSLGRTLDAPLDAVVVSGDVTLYGRADGFHLLPELLAKLGDRLPDDPRRIVVVPGNHDVVRDTAPSTQERYERFRALEEHGYTLPLLDGIDIDSAGGTLTDRDPTVAIGDDVLVVALNSANYSGMVEPLSTQTQAAIEQAAAKGHLNENALAELFEKRRRDAARISPGQLRAVKALLPAPTGPGLPPLRIVVLHHQLLPVNTTEEYKPYESLSNLGEVRQFLLSAGFDVVLHGHKHAENVLVDEIADTFARADGTHRAQRVLICSCGTVGGGRGHGSEIAKLLVVETTAQRARSMSVLTVPGLSGGGELPSPLAGVSFAVQRTPPDASRLVAGATTSDVQAILREMFDGAPDKRMTDLVCVVEETSGADRLPDGYPQADGGRDDDEKWFADTVGWWQDPAVVEGKPFTHGQRVRAFGESRRDQLAAAAEVLTSDPMSSRAVIVLMDPDGDRPESVDSRFPSFTAVQLHSEGSRLHATAFFRKQEMRFWWAVNVAEIAVMRAEVIARVQAHGRKLYPGRITTVASQAIGAQSRPSVAVPAIDRLAWTPLGPHRLWLLCSAVFYDSTPGRDRLLAELRGLVEDWKPPAAAGPDGVAVPEHGLELLRQGLEALHDQFGAPPGSLGEALIGHLKLLQAHADIYRHQVRTDASAAFARWRAEAAPSIADVLGDLDRLGDSADDSRAAV